MTQKKKYSLLITGCVLMGVYLGATTVWDRWMEIAGRWTDLDNREATLVGPDDLEARKLALLQERTALTSKIAESTREYAQNQTGLFEFLSRTASEQGFRYRSLEPSAEKVEGGVTELSFKASFAADYLTAGRWLKSVESGAIPVRVTGLEISTKNVLSTRLEVAVSGTAYLFSGLKRQ
jgi:hypothetical protein